MRYAVYFTPPQDHLLTRLASAWIGRDAFVDGPLPPPSGVAIEAGDIAFITAAARRYGFHATLKAPFALAQDATEAALRAAAEAFAIERAPFALPELRVTSIDGFLALAPVTPCPQLDALAKAAVIDFDRFRAPLTETDYLRRHPERLSLRQVGHLRRWGYPFVFDDFRFHMTLTGPVEARASSTSAGVLTDYLAPALEGELWLDSVTLFVEPAPGAPFRVLSTHALAARRDRLTA